MNSNKLENMTIETLFWPTLLSIIIPTGIAVFVVLFTLHMQNKNDRKQVFHAVNNEVIDNAVMIKKLEDDLKKDLEFTGSDKYSMTFFPMLYLDSWILLKTRYIHTVKHDSYIKLIRYYAYVRNLNLAIEFRNNFILQAPFIPNAKPLQGLDKDIEYRIEIVKRKQKEIEDVLKELL